MSGWNTSACNESRSCSAAWARSNSARDELAPQGTHVMTVHCSFVDTDMTTDIELPKMPPGALVTMVLDALEMGEPEVLADQFARNSKAMLSGCPLGRPPF